MSAAPPDPRDSESPKSDLGPAADLPVSPARFWAILHGADPTADEIAYIRGREALRRIACTVLQRRNDPRLSLFGPPD